jgi:putative flippase GtrA
MKVNLKETGKQFFKFGLIGVSNTLLSLAVYYTLVFLGLHYIAAYTVGFCLSVLNSYYFNSNYVFQRSTQSRLASFTKSFLTYVSTFAIGTFFLYLMVNNLHISDKIAPLINLTFTVPTNFIIHRFWVFR